MVVNGRGRPGWRVAVLSVCMVLWAGCDDAGDDASPEDAAVVDAEMPPVTSVELRCDPSTARGVPVEAVASLACDMPPDTRTISDGAGSFEIFTYEASHPLADAEQAYPCAVEPGMSYQAPDIPTAPCSRAGVRPWHSVLWAEADAACQQIGWRLCTTDELTRACGGAGRTAYTYGDRFDGGRCNFREAWTAPGAALASEAPSGAFERCVSTDGVFDANGNLWEWAAAEGGEAERRYQGGGWRTQAQFHQADEQTCDFTIQLPAAASNAFHSPAVGFRCCR